MNCGREAWPTSALQDSPEVVSQCGQHLAGDAEALSRLSRGSDSEVFDSDAASPERSREPAASPPIPGKQIHASTKMM